MAPFQYTVRVEATADPTPLPSRVLRPINSTLAEPPQARATSAGARNRSGVDQGETRHLGDGGPPDVRREEPKPGGYGALRSIVGAHRVEKEVGAYTGKSTLATGNRATVVRPESLSGCIFPPLCAATCGVSKHAFAPHAATTEFWQPTGSQRQDSKLATIRGYEEDKHRLSPKPPGFRCRQPRSIDTPVRVPTRAGEPPYDRYTYLREQGRTAAGAPQRSRSAETPRRAEV
jgi:hypothetical protein